MADVKNAPASGVGWSALFGFCLAFDNVWNDLHISYPTGCQFWIDGETDRKMQRSSNITEYQDTTTGRNLRKKKTAISGYANHGKNVSAPLFRIILNSRMMRLPAPEWWLRKQKYSCYRQVQRMFWFFSAFLKYLEPCAGCLYVQAVLRTTRISCATGCCLRFG